MTKYKLCPRCDLNYITEDDDLCDVCKGNTQEINLDDDEIITEAEMLLCPICSQNYISEDEKACSECLAKINAKKEEESLTYEEPEKSKLSTEEELTFDELQETEEEFGVGEDVYDDIYDN